MLHAGLIGFPASGKTTLFHLLTGPREGGRPPAGRTEAALGVAKVPDTRLDRLVTMFNPRRRVPATVEFADSPGGTRSGHGLVEVAAYRNADTLLHVVRLFESETTPHPAGSIDAARDARAMEDELILADLGVTERRLERIAKDLKKGGGAELQREAATLERCRTALEQGQPLRTLGLDAEDTKRLRGFQLLSAKPLLLVLNVSEAAVGDLHASERAIRRAGLTAFLASAHAAAVPVAATIELEIAGLEPADAAAFLSDMGLSESGLDRIIRATYELLGYISFFTVGEDECRAWSIARGTTAQMAAGEIHTDLARGFIRAEVVAYDRLVARGSLAACRDHGEVRLEGKEYIVADGDVITFRFAT